MKKYIQETLLVINLLLLLGLYALIAYWYFYLYDENMPEIQSNEIVLNQDVSDEKIVLEIQNDSYVDIKGAVVKPGVYKIGDNTILNDIIIAAGGFQKNAYTLNLNLSKKLSGETVIYVYNTDEYLKLSEANQDVHNSVQDENAKKEELVCVCECPEVDISACLNNGASIIVPEDKDENKEQINPDESKENNLININTASLEQLTSLNGIGDAKAKKIIEYRQENGPFIKIEDIKNVSGISEAIYEKIKNNITI